MKRLLYSLAIVVTIVTACTRDLSDLNIDPKNPSTAPSYAFFTNAVRSFSNTLTSSNVNLNIFRLITQQWQETQYPEESQYDLGTREINDAVWNAMYRDVINDLREAKRLIPSDVSGADKQKNQLAVAEVMEIYAWYYLVTTFGNVPYSEALDINKPFPKYDDAKTIYNDLLTRLDAAIAKINTSAEGFGNADIVYNGNMALWKKFANSLKLKMGILIADDDNARAKAVVESAVASGVFTSNADNARVIYQSAPPNTNPIWVDLVQSGRDDFVGASTLIDTLKAKNDPRLDNFFTRDQSGVNYSGAAPGVQSAYAQYSHVHPDITSPTFPGLLMDYAEVEFYLAEAAQRGYNVGGTAATHYNNAVTASILYWGGTTAEALTYLARPDVVYNPANWRKSIGVQQWIAFYNRGWDAWISWRRLDYPVLLPAHDALSGIPLRYPYPVNEQNVNTANYNQAATAIGGDDVSTRLWWDKF
ncbi:MAG TPA: SusD/RagB family nutrient-binding outer membrane lipoprotein [Chitinophagaceae bacterium]|nr:SusD/RagB family nutrient-binding outer membrane lipoprotein [Chitinophagaceae bacterium]